MSARRDASVVVLGAGVSGLTYAWTLKRLGFSNVKVLERAPRVGGKSCTLMLEGRPHDLGATMGTPIDYELVDSFAQRSGVKRIDFPKQMHFDLGTGKRRKLNRKRELPRVFLEAAKYCMLHRFAWKGVDGDGLENASPELHVSWSDLVKARKCEAVSDRMLTYRAGYGYGFDDEVPAAMYANLIRPQTVRGLSRRPNMMWEGGTQGIWEGLARNLDVQTGVDVQQVRRTENGATLSIIDKDGSARTVACDHLVTAFDPKAALTILDGTEEEKRAFNAIRTYPYATFAAKVSGLHEGASSVGYIAQNMTKARMGHPMAWVKRYADHDVFVFHLFAPTHLTDADIDRNIAEDMRALGSTMTSVLERRRWTFFPHYAPADFGFIRDVDRRQGHKRTVVLGEAFSFSSMARVAEHAERTATRFASGELGGAT